MSICPSGSAGGIFDLGGLLKRGGLEDLSEFDLATFEVLGIPPLVCSSLPLLPIALPPALLPQRLTLVSPRTIV